MCGRTLPRGQFEEAREAIRNADERIDTLKLVILSGKKSPAAETKAVRKLLELAGVDEKRVKLVVAEWLREWNPST